MEEGKNQEEKDQQEEGRKEDEEGKEYNEPKYMQKEEEGWKKGRREEEGWRKEEDREDENGLNTRLEWILERWFEIHSHDGSMSKDDFVIFANSCISKSNGLIFHIKSYVYFFFNFLDSSIDTYSITDRRVSEVFARFASESESSSFLTLADFLSYYRSLCLSRPKTVQSHLQVHNIGVDLLPEAAEPPDEELLPRRIISRDNKLYQVLFGLLEERAKSVCEPENLHATRYRQTVI